MRPEAIAAPLLAVLMVTIGGWAFLRTLDPEMLLAILRTITFC